MCVCVCLSTQQLDQLSEQNNTLKMTLKDTEAKVIGGGAIHLLSFDVPVRHCTLSLLNLHHFLCNLPLRLITALCSTFITSSYAIHPSSISSFIVQFLCKPQVILILNSLSSLLPVAQQQLCACACVCVCVSLDESAHGDLGSRKFHKL